MASTTGELEKRRLLLGLSASSLDDDGDSESTSMLSFSGMPPLALSRGRSEEIGDVSMLSLSGSYGVALALDDDCAGVEKGGNW